MSKMPPKITTQGSYCSSMYPNIETSQWQCEWCIYEHEQMHGSHNIAAKIKKRSREVSTKSNNDRVNAKKLRLIKHHDNEQSSSMNLSCRLPPRVVGRKYKLLVDVS